MSPRHFFMTFTCLLITIVCADPDTAFSDDGFANRLTDAAETHIPSSVQPSFSMCDSVAGTCEAASSWDHANSCEDGTRDGGLYAGFEFMFVKPHLKESFKAFGVDLATGTQHLYGFNQSYDLAPRVFLGYQTAEGLGVRTRYWQYDQEADPLTFISSNTNIVAAQTVTVVFPGVIQSTAPGQVLSVGNGLKVQTLDLEGTQQLTIGRVDAVVGMGLRYAMLRQTFQASIMDGGIPVQALASEREFEGFGPILRAEFSRQLGQSGFSGFGSLGGGILFGNKSLRRSAFGSQAALPPFISMDNIDEVTGMGELQVGLQWSRCTRLGRFRARGSYEAQLWSDAGAPTLTFLGFEGLGFLIGLER